MAAKDIDPNQNGIDNVSIEAGTQDFVLTCGVCHVGGGQLEYDRNGAAYSAISPAGDRFMFEKPSLSNPNPIAVSEGFMNGTNKAEADCLMCHLDYGKVYNSWRAANGYTPVYDQGDGATGHGRALYQTWGCSDLNPVGPGNDKNCDGIQDAGYETMGALPAGPFKPGTSYDMYNRNFAIKMRRLDLAPAMGLGAVGIMDLNDNLTGIDWTNAIGPVSVDDDNDPLTPNVTYNTVKIPGIVRSTPKSANCAPCHARDEETVGLSGMTGMKTGYGNFLLKFAPGQVLDSDNGLGVANSKDWMVFGCKTGMGKRTHKIGKPGDSIGANGVYTPAGMMVQMGYAQAGDPIPGKMPDIDVHDRAGMSCATCHYALGSIDADTDTDGDLVNDARTFPAGEHHHVEYPSEVVKGIDHQFAQGDSSPDTKGKNNLDGTTSCESCHITMTHPRLQGDATTGYTIELEKADATGMMTVDVPQPAHVAFPSLHLDKIACATCHIPEAYAAPGRLKYRDWTAGNWRDDFRNMLDWNFDLMTGSNNTVPIVRQWMTKFGEKKIYPVLPGILPIWVESLSNPGQEAGNETGVIDGLDYDGTPYPSAATIKSPVKARDTVKAAAALRDLPGNPYDIRLNGGNAVPLFDGFVLADAWEIDTQAEIEAMLGAFQTHSDANAVALKLFQANFDVTHGTVPKEWALGGAARGGCVSCHSSADPTDANYSPYSVAFFEGYVQPLNRGVQTLTAMGLPASVAVGSYDMLKNWFSMFADFDCTALCGAGSLGDYDDPLTTGVVEGLFDPNTGAPVSGTTCGAMSPMHNMIDSNGNGDPTDEGADAMVDHCVGMMTTAFDAAMGFPSGTAMNMGMYDGITGLQGFVVRETAAGDLMGCNPFNKNDANSDGYADGVYACMNHPEGNLMYSRQEVRSHFTLDLQQSYMGGTKRVTWPVSGEKNPSNAAHVNSWDQADYCLDYSGGNPFAPGVKACNDPELVSMDGKKHIANRITANQFLGYTNSQLGLLKTAQTSPYFQNLDAMFTNAADTATAFKVNVNASTSLCPNANGCTYEWTSASAVSGGSAGVTSVFTYPAAGFYSVTLKVTDPDTGYSDTMTKNVEAKELAPPPTTTASYSAVGNTVTVTLVPGGTATNIQSAYVRWGDGAITRYYPNTWQNITHTYPTSATAKTYSLYVRVLDNAGIYTTKTFSVTIP